MLFAIIINAFNKNFSPKLASKPKLHIKTVAKKLPSEIMWSVIIAGRYAVRDIRPNVNPISWLNKNVPAVSTVDNRVNNNIIKAVFFAVKRLLVNEEHTQTNNVKIINSKIISKNIVSELIIACLLVKL